ncbi:unnamed protein product [Acanthoscelides obtectus]|uniref:Uncharacterized protein n=1 Tax=Acanthoscelides obtectus TaxID=200917 RepID=A0A9P0QAA8_ACAOB|nr:unnamed protein product [Acanthoscelides obtectus]CAK1649139.1 hypothetical protein AOBTE_LOCUS16066 [Acanthoscelides obtectus]
MIPGNLIK